MGESSVYDNKIINRRILSAAVGGASVTFTSQYGLVSLFNLPMFWRKPCSSSESTNPTGSRYQPPLLRTSSWQGAKVSAMSNSESQDIFATIEKLASLLEKGYLSPEEFAEKKKELLSRLCTNSC